MPESRLSTASIESFLSFVVRKVHGIDCVAYKWHGLISDAHSMFESFPMQFDLIWLLSENFIHWEMALGPLTHTHMQMQLWMLLSLCVCMAWGLLTSNQITCFLMLLAVNRSNLLSDLLRSQSIACIWMDVDGVFFSLAASISISLNAVRSLLCVFNLFISRNYNGAARDIFTHRQMNDEKCNGSAESLWLPCENVWWLLCILKCIALSHLSIAFLIARCCRCCWSCTHIQLFFRSSSQLLAFFA